MYKCDQKVILENGENLLKEEESNLFTITLEKKTVIQFRKIIYNRINKIIIAYCTKKVINFKTKKDK